MGKLEKRRESQGMQRKNNEGLKKCGSVFFQDVYLIFLRE